MTVQELYNLEGGVWDEIQNIKQKRELETKAFIEGMEKGSDLMLRAVKNFLNKEDEIKKNDR